MRSTRFRPRSALIALLAMVLFLSACDTAEERAEEHFQNALALLEQGDVARARVELLSVFKYNGEHRDARATLARAMLSDGDLPSAFSQYLRLVEQYPNDLEGRLMLSEMGILMDNWEAVGPHARALGELAPDSPRTQIVQNALSYRESILDDDVEARREAAKKALELKPALSESVINRAVIIDSMIMDGENAAALAELDEVQQIAPRDRRFFQMRLGILNRMEDMDGVEQTLLKMVDTFPEDAAIASTLISFYRSRDDLDGAEEFLRSRVSPGDKDDDVRVALIRFVADAKGPEAALVEADRFIREGTNDQLFGAMRATLLFDMGDVTQSITELEALLEGAEASDETREIRITLAQVLERTGNEVGSRSLVESVLEEDPGMVNALRMKASWLIEADLADQAIVLLRRALDQDPSNPQVLTAMAEAHLRNGDRDLAGEMLSLAVSASNRAPRESLDYATFLAGEKRYAAAEGVLIDALRFQPENLELLTELGRVYIVLEDWPRAEQVERTLRAIEGAEANTLADRIRVTILRAQQRDTDAIAFLENLVDQQGGYRAAEIAIVRAHLERNDTKAALDYLRELLDKSPEDPSLRFLLAAVSAATGDMETAEQEYRGLMEEGEGGERVWMELIRVLNATGRGEEAERLVSEGLTEIPEAPDLMWMRATFLERRRDYEGAIEIYEKLYARNTSTSVIANNLASLLSTTRDDAESLDRAWRIARRLRDSDFPPYQDTYGWLAYRRGEYEDALRHLEPAARGLPRDALVQYHLAMTYTALERYDDAIAQFERALEIAGDDPRPAFETARRTLAEIKERDNRAPTASEQVESLPQPSASGVVRNPVANE